MALVFEELNQVGHVQVQAVLLSEHEAEHPRSVLLVLALTVERTRVVSGNAHDYDRVH